MPSRTRYARKPNKQTDDVNPAFDLLVGNAYELSPIEFEKLPVGHVMGYVFLAVRWSDHWTAYRGLWGVSAKELRDYGDSIDKELALHIFPCMAYSRLPYTE